MASRILIVEDDPALLEALAIFLQGAGFECGTAGDGEAAARLLEGSSYDIILTDILLPGQSGLDVLKLAAERCPETPVIIMTAHGTLDSAVYAMREGAIDYIAKPITFEEALLRIRRVLRERDRLAELRLLRREVDRSRDLAAIVGGSAVMQGVFATVRKVAATTSTVLITGESGTGKELVARAIHGVRAAAPERFVAVNCAAIPEHLLESELFGHVKGAFTGAGADKRGLFEMAEGGSLFLDEVSEMSLGLQAKLLRAIETKEIRRVGGIDPVRLNVRILCATNRDLLGEVRRGTFREDLYYRMSIVEVRLPPLRERREDIPGLVQHFVARLNRDLKAGYVGVEPAALQMLVACEWRGNVRELQNVIERAMILGDGRRIRVADLPPHIAARGGAGVLDLKQALAQFESAHIRAVLESVQGLRAEAAKALGIGLSSLYRKMAKMGLEATPEAGVRCGTPGATEDAGGMRIPDVTAGESWSTSG